MMDKPEGIEQRDWDDACEAMDRAGWYMRSVRVECAKSINQARSQAFEESAKLIEEGFEKVVGEPYRDDGKPSKNDKCPHGRYMYEDCESCCSQAIRQHSQKGRDK